MEKEKYWFVAVVTPNTEKSCRERLGKLIEVESYVPIQRELHEWPSTGRRVWVDKVLCPCYLFIRSTDKERYEIACKAKFILHFMMDRARKDANGRNDFARIPNSQMESFMLMVGDGDRKVTIEPASLRVGDKVRIKTGRLAGLEG
ncbi:MAG: transcription termination/antitermination NusG family protein, partial [Prevotella sp.]